MNEHIPPHDLGAEASVLGAMMLSREAAATAVEILRPDDFYRPAHATVFAVIATALAEGEPIDVSAVMTRLAASGDLNRVGGGNALHDLVSAVPVAASVGWHGRIVAERAQSRRLIEVGTRIAQMGYEAGRDPAEAAAQGAKLLADAVDARSKNDPIRWGDLGKPALDAIEAAAKMGDTPGLSTGIKRLDAMLGGLRGGQLVIVAGRPGMGKSIVSVDWARRVAMHQGKAAALFSLEMSRYEIYNRIISAETDTSLARITRGRLEDGQWFTLSKRTGATEDAPLFIDDSSPITFTDIITKSRRLHARTPLSLIVVDYLQLLSSGNRTENRQQEVSDISRGLKSLARELDVPIIAAAQLNRGVEMRADKRPLLSDLRESGSVEQDADIVIMLYRDDYYSAKSQRKGVLDLIVSKHRAGPQGTVYVTTDFAHGRILDTAVQTEEPPR